MRHKILAAALACLLISSGCGNRDDPPRAQTGNPRPSILLVTLDTTRADAIGPDAKGVRTPAFNAVVQRGRRFTSAYATVPETLPSHSSMMTGLYPAGHGVHENARYLAPGRTLAAEKLSQAGYKTAAFVSSFTLARRFGLARGFEVYDDDLPDGGSERGAKETTDRALAYLERMPAEPHLVWIHYFDPHTPYAPPAPFKSEYATAPYLGEVAAMDEQLGRLVAAFDRRTGGSGAIIIAADHGEGLGDHGEPQHGTLLYQSTMHVPLVIAGPGVASGVVDAPVSTRRIFHTILDWAGIDATGSLRGTTGEVVLGEAMKPFLEYGWQPQIMAVEGRMKSIMAGRLETYDLGTDPGEHRNLGAGANLAPAVRTSLDDYPVPSAAAARTPENLTDDAKRRLASLGYIGASAAPLVRKDAPRPADMVHLFEPLERASTLFVQQRYAQAVPILEGIIAADPYNLDAALRLATAHSALGHEAQALEGFRRAAKIAPQSEDVRVYLALHYANGRDWREAVPMLEKIVAATPERVPAVEALGRLKARLGALAMEQGDTGAALRAFEEARRFQGPAFRNDLELGVLYLASRRLPEAKDALDRVPSSHPDYSMALFKRAQVSVLLKEPDAAARIAQARQRADATTRPLIEREALFRGR